jgi:hypothetical protein
MTISAAKTALLVATIKALPQTTEKVGYSLSTCDGRIILIAIRDACDSQI